jgi:hypothetical protein
MTHHEGHGFDALTTGCDREGKKKIDKSFPNFVAFVIFVVQIDV